MSLKGCSLPLLGETMHSTPLGSNEPQGMQPTPAGRGDALNPLKVFMSPKGCSLPLLGEAMHLFPLGTNEPQGMQPVTVGRGDALNPLGV